MAVQSQDERRRIEDHRWGRLPGTRPPLPSWAPIAWWAATSIFLSVAVVLVVGRPGPLDDPDEGNQRPGFLVDADEARRVAGLDLPGDPVGHRPVLLMFAREAPDPDELGAFVSRAPADYVSIVVLPRRGRPQRQPTPLVPDRGRRIARQVGMPAPKDGGFPVGYAIIDRDGRVRYATLDPSYPEHGFELEVVAEAVA